MQAAQHEATAASVEDFASLRDLHWDGAQGQFLDFGRHTEGIELRWVLDRDPDGRPIGRRLERAVLAPPRLQHVPHFGCDTGLALGPCGGGRKSVWQRASSCGGDRPVNDCLAFLRRLRTAGIVVAKQPVLSGLYVCDELCYATLARPTSADLPHAEAVSTCEQVRGSLPAAHAAAAARVPGAGPPAAPPSR